MNTNVSALFQNRNKTASLKQTVLFFYPTIYLFHLVLLHPRPEHYVPRYTVYGMRVYGLRSTVYGLRSTVYGL
ncbi:hypothetical protein LQV63_22145, partial [Paenibacillus profundus]|nr:hypothetical protein [Paenibacillus profundus]